MIPSYSISGDENRHGAYNDDDDRTAELLMQVAAIAGSEQASYHMLRTRDPTARLAARQLPAAAQASCPFSCPFGCPPPVAALLAALLAARPLR